MKKEKTIVLVSNTSWSLYNFRLGLIRRLTSEGYNVVAVAPKDNFTAKLVSEGITYRSISLDNYGTNPINELKLIRQLARIYREVDADLIFHYTIKPNIYGSIASFLSKKPSIIITTGLGHLFEFSNIVVQWITILMYRIAAYLSKEVWFLNDNDRDVFVYKRIVSRKKASVLHSEGIDTKWFAPRSDKRHSGSIRFLFAGRLIWDKGVREYVEAAKIIKQKYRKVKFEILGFTDQTNPNSVPYEQIESWQKAKIVNYLGETTDVRYYLQKANCLVFPSFYREGVSRILMEAAAMATPIITTDNVGCKDIVEHEKNGYLVPTKDVQALVQAIERFIELSDVDKDIMGNLGRKMVIDRFAEGIVLQKYEDTIRRYTDSDSPRQTKRHTYQS